MRRGFSTLALRCESLNTVLLYNLPEPLYLVQNLVQVMDDLVKENAELNQQLTRKEAEAEETIRREQEQMRQLVHTHADVRGSPGILLSSQHVRSSVGVCQTI